MIALPRAHTESPKQGEQTALLLQPNMGVELRSEQRPPTGRGEASLLFRISFPVSVCVTRGQSNFPDSLIALESGSGCEPSQIMD